MYIDKIKVKKSKNNLLEECTNNSDLILILKERLDSAYGVLEGVIIYVFFNPKTNEQIILGDNLSDKQQLIFPFIMNDTIKEAIPDLNIEKWSKYNG